MKSIGKRLYLARRQQKLSMSAIANMTGISVSLISRIEKDNANPTADVLSRLAQALGGNLGDLMKAKNEVTLPVSLMIFISEYRDKYGELNEYDWQELLANICIGGRHPKTTEDWLLIFLHIKRSLK